MSQRLLSDNEGMELNASIKLNRT